MKSNLKLGLFAIAILSAVAASAGVSVVSGTTDGRISIQSNTYAGVSGNGGSLSHADSQATAQGILNTSAGGATFSAVGGASGSVDAAAYNTKIGNGFGSANAGGWSDQSVRASGSVVGINGSTTGQFSVDGGMTDAVRNGVDAHVNAGTAQDGYASGTYAGTASIMGTLTGSVSSITGAQTADGKASAGAITFTDGTPAGQSAAYRSANTGVVVDVTGQNRMVDGTAGFGL